MPDEVISPFQPQDGDSALTLQKRLGAAAAALANAQAGSKFSNAVIGSVTTANPGNGWTVFGAQACDQVVVINNSGVDVEVQRNAVGTAMPILDGNFYTFVGVTNANQLRVRRIDQDNAQVTLQTEAHTI